LISSGSKPYELTDGQDEARVTDQASHGGIRKTPLRGTGRMEEPQQQVSFERFIALINKEEARDLVRSINM
jgi:hypothetical protein